MSATRVSVTDIDSWARYKRTEEMELAEILRRLRRQEEPSAAMLAGRALHKLLELAPTSELEEVEIDGVRFFFGCDAEVELPPLRELKVERHVGDVTVVGRVDGAQGRRLWDHKLSSRFDLDNYAESLQWRLYLWLLDADRFTYNVFVGGESGRVYLIRELHQCDFYRYPALEADVLTEIRGYVDFYRRFVAPGEAA